MQSWSRRSVLDSFYYDFKHCGLHDRLEFRIRHDTATMQVHVMGVLNMDAVESVEISKLDYSQINFQH